MAEDFKQNEDVLALARYLALGILISISLAAIFGFLDLLLEPNSTLVDYTTKNIWTSLYTLSFLIALLTGIYALLIQLAQDDSNIIRVVSLIYAMALLSVVLIVLFNVFGFTYANPVPFTI